MHVYIVHVTGMLLHTISNYGAFRPHPLLIMRLAQILFPVDRTLCSICTMGTYSRSFKGAANGVLRVLQRM